MAKICEMNHYQVCVGEVVAELSAGKVDIYVGGVWAGSGVWDADAETIRDCAARLGADEAETEMIYDQLDEAIVEAIDEE